MGKYSDKLEEIKRLIGDLQKEAPDQIQAFHQFMAAVEKPGAMDAKAKELVNVALAVAAQCEWCIALHVKGALDAGASRAEVIDAGMQAVLMHGGPALMYMTPLTEALKEFEDGKEFGGK
ncbi:carboxymuconolactone decarboxylase family protein [Nitratifractor sp.]